MVFGDGLNEAEQKTALLEMKRCLRPNGLLLIGLNGAGHPCYSASAHELLDSPKQLKLQKLQRRTTNIMSYKDEEITVVEFNSVIYEHARVNAGYIKLLSEIFNSVKFIACKTHLKPSMK